MVNYFYIPDSEGNDFTNNLKKEIYEEIKKVVDSLNTTEEYTIPFNIKGL